MASGGEMEEAFYGGIGAGFTIGLVEGLGSMGRLRGFRNPQRLHRLVTAITYTIRTTCSRRSKGSLR